MHQLIKDGKSTSFKKFLLVLYTTTTTASFTSTSTSNEKHLPQFSWMFITCIVFSPFSSFIVYVPCSLAASNLLFSAWAIWTLSWLSTVSIKFSSYWSFYLNDNFLYIWIPNCIGMFQLISFLLAQLFSYVN